ncbi:DNA polymerase III subunit alpha [Athalassotoga saccharophila]|uniref:DNA polymerase III subunit alpha n=1 Tax=Athalassotoga saccharophila TaxID=1441386 RepID=UPI001379F699|nr:DNA polymerase III subunit alpha [Athalassotoga saccharophila]BBJ28881.1 DNA polymerase III subunit alpha [Athalassotoga saccharophila]
MDKFVHLHLHTEYSIGDSTVRIDDLMNQAKSLGMDALAITDHGTMGGVHKFWSAARKYGIKPVIGCELYVKDEKTRNHLTVLAKNKDGYLSLVKALNLANSKVLDDKDIFELKDVIVLSGCMSGKIPRLILNGEIERAKEVARAYRERFGEDFYIELMRTGLKDQIALNNTLVDIAQSLKIKIVATNDVHFLKKADALAHGLFVSMNRNMKWDGNVAYGSDEYYLKSAGEMKVIFRDLPQSVDNTVEISEKCEEYDLAVDIKLPFSSEKDCETLKGRISKVSEDRKKRLDRELKLIESKNFCRYFLTVSEIIDYAQKAGILIGPGRGSSVSSLVAYLLGITTIDPLKYDLIFERFLNESRMEDPDIDIDVEDGARDDLILGLAQKYGTNNLAQVGSYGTLGSRAVIRLAGKSLGVNERLIEDLAWRVSGYDSIEKAINENQEFRRISKSEDVKVLVDYALKLEGLIHHRTIHAAGVVLSDRDLTNLIPMTFDGKRWITEFDMDSLADLRITKIDLLGLKTLTNIKETLGGKVNREDLMNIPIDHEGIYEILKSGNTAGIFQLESASASALTKKLAPQNFDDIIALLSLNRPGPIYSGIADEYIRRRHGGSVMKDEFGLDKILGETYGMIIYQEQVMKIAMEIASFSESQADLFRKAISKKDPALMQDLKEKFVSGAISKGYSENMALKLFDNISNFASYGFNKSHSVAYAYITAWTAYLKATMTANFMVSLMNSNISDPAKLSIYKRELERLSVKVLPPDINESKTLFYSDGKNVRTGFAAIKGIGINLGHIIEEERTRGKFENFLDFVSRMKKRVNSKSLEILVLSGAFDSTDPNRKYLIDNMESLMDLSEGGLKIIQQQLFGSEERKALPPIENYPDYSPSEKIKLQRQYVDLLFDREGDDFEKVMERGHGRVTFQVFEKDGLIFATDGKNELPFSYDRPLKEGESYEGEFIVKNGNIILSRLVSSSNETYVYLKDPSEVDSYIPRISDMKDHRVIFKVGNLYIVLEDKTLKEEEG